VRPKTFLLDRDGVINYDSNHYIRKPSDWKPIPGSLDAIAQLKKAGYKVVVVTNQSGIGRGYLDIHDLNEIHNLLLVELASRGATIDAFFFCPHHPDENCICRKPSDGLLTSLGQKLNIDLAGVPFVGDKESDALAALSVGARPILVKTGIKFPETSRVDCEIFENLGQVVRTFAR
jgi:D-glycero-D-manno-heptose 1,7-bisphosphate phosphatase